MIGRYLVKYTIRLKLVVNADRFQSGRYILAGIPVAGIYPIQKGLDWALAHRHTTMQVTQLPHAELDINGDTECNLILPWVGTFLGQSSHSWTAHTGIGSPWAVFLYPYHPLVTTAGSSNATFTLFVSLEDVELGIAALSQMGRGFKAIKGRDPIVDEQNSKNIGPISSSLSNISKALNYVADIPLLSSIASPTSWAMECLARAANVFGWSRPLNVAPRTRIINTPYAYMATGDASCEANPLSITANNHVAVLPGFARTDMDELSINYLKSIPAFFNKTEWTYARAVDDVLIDLPLLPSYYSVASFETIALLNMTPICWLSSFFIYWRGSLTYNFKFVKTMFHSGRLMVVFNPRPPYDGISSDATIASSNYCYREIIDLKDCSEFQITVPYVNTHPWHPVQGVSLGALQVLVLDPLIAPATVSNSIQMLIEVCGGPDFELACPCSRFISQFQPCLPYTAQMAIGSEVGATSFGDNIGGMSIPSQNTWPSEACIGEKILSLRTLLKRYSLCAGTSGTASRRRVQPFKTEWAVNVDATHCYPVTNKPDMYTYVSSPFLFSRGGMRIKNRTFSSLYTGTVTMEIPVAGTTTNNIVTDSALVTRASVAAPLCPTIEIMETLNGCAEVQVPMYHYTHSRHVGADIVNAAVFTNSCADGVTSNMVLYFDYDIASNPSGFYTYRAGADDLNLGYFISIPPMYAPT